MHSEILDLNQVIGKVARMLRRLLGAHIALELRLTTDRTALEADLSMLEQIVVNLAVNARDAMPEGGRLTLATAVVTVERTDALEPDAYPGRFAKLMVADTGSGIAPEVLPHIFEPFFTTKDVGRGAGLGLATVFSIVQQHRGWIRVNSELGAGTAFDIFLPASSATPRPAVSPAPRAAEGHETILLVEDEPGVRRMATQALTRAGYRVLGAGSGVEALAVWEEHGHEIDLVFTDMVMPEGLTGQELAARLREYRPGLKIVFTSGYSADFVGDTTLREGVNFLSKPYTFARLAQTLRACLDESDRETGPTH